MEPEIAQRNRPIDRWMPGVRMVRTYRATWLRPDLIAGAVLAAILVPQGMAYAELAGLPPVTGLYTTIACLVGYAVFGPSRILVLGPDSSVSPLIFAAIAAPSRGARPEHRDRPRRDDGADGRRHRDRAWPRQARVRRRSPVQGGAGRIHERPGHHDHRRPAAEALRILDRCGRFHRRDEGVRVGAGPDEHDGARDRRGNARGPDDPAADHDPGTGGARRGSRRDRGDRRCSTSARKA